MASNVKHTAGGGADSAFESADMEDRLAAASDPAFPEPPTAARSWLPLRAIDVQVYRWCDALTEPGLYLAVVFSPWAFGSTEPWSIWVMNAAGGLLGILFVVKLLIRRLKGYHAPRWGQPAASAAAESRGSARGGAAAWLTGGLAWLTILLLLYMLVSAINARATCHPALASFEYHDCISWLPHSFDSRSTWFTFWTCLGLAGAFWAARDWLLGKSRGEEVAQWRPPAASEEARTPMPARLRRLLWLLAINGAVLAVESLAQRLADSPKLLFVVLPRIHQTAATQLGPFAYRSNGAQYFNLLWPVCVGFWWTLNRTYGGRRFGHHALLGCAALMATGSIISTSRAGAAVTAAILATAALLLPATHFLLAARPGEHRRNRRLTMAALGFFFVGVLALGFTFGWKAMKPRLAELEENLTSREALFDTGRRMARDYPVFGTGPGTYESVSALYRPPELPLNAFWPAQLHNDWVEIRLTFGWVGSVMIFLALMTVLARWFARGGIHGGRRFVLLTWLALAGCLAHARYDFPFQVHSILFLFLLICAVLTTLTRRPGGPPARM